jgi:hypothetical protein
MRIPRNLLQMRQNPRNHLELPAATGAQIDLDANDALQALRQAHGHVTRGDGFVGGLITLPIAAHAPMRRRHRCPKLAVRGEHPMESGQVHPGRRHQGCRHCHQIQRLQHDVRGAFTVRSLERLANLAG